MYSLALLIYLANTYYLCQDIGFCYTLFLENDFFNDHSSEKMKHDSQQKIILNANNKLTLFCNERIGVL